MCDCVIRKDTFRIFGNLTQNPIGWVEKDGKKGPSNPEEYVNIGEGIENGVTINIDCNKW